MRRAASDFRPRLLQFTHRADGNHGNIQPIRDMIRSAVASGGHFAGEMPAAWMVGAVGFREIGLKAQAGMEPNRLQTRLYIRGNEHFRAQSQSSDLTPQNHPTGFSHVMVNGRFALRDGLRNDEQNGRVLRH